MWPEKLTYISHISNRKLQVETLIARAARSQFIDKYQEFHIDYRVQIDSTQIMNICI